MTNKDKNEMVRIGVTEAARILIHTMIYVDAPNFIRGNIVDEGTGETYKLNFEKIKQESIL